MHNLQRSLASERNQKIAHQLCLVAMYRDKKCPKAFSSENSLTPSKVPPRLQGLTQTEEMLIARALPIMRVHIKPGGQRGYSGHCINLPQDIKELASSLPRYPKDIALIVMKVKGRNNTFKDLKVRKEKVQNALKWLVENNPHYAGVDIKMVCQQIS